jgi:hypothetical protein
MQHKFDTYVKVKTTGKISKVLDCEKIFNTNLYYLSDGTSFAEHQLLKSNHSEFVNSKLFENHNDENELRRVANNVVNNLLKPFNEEIKRNKKIQEEKRRKNLITTLGFLFLGLILLTTFLL